MELPSEGGGAVPRWLDLTDDAKVLALPVNSAIAYAARARADALLVQAAEAGSVVTKLGAHITGLPDLTDEVEQNGVWTMFYTLSIAELTVTDWDGVTENKEPVPFRPALLARLLADDRAIDAFTRQQLRRHNSLVREGNA